MFELGRSGSDSFSSSEQDDSSSLSYEDIEVCRTRKHRFNPNELVDSQAWEFDSDFRQIIEVELCEDPGSPCNDYPMIKTKCKQRFLSIQLQVVSKLNQKRGPYLKTFLIPSNCVCALA